MTPDDPTFVHVRVADDVVTPRQQSFTSLDITEKSDIIIATDSDDSATVRKKHAEKDVIGNPYLVTGSL